MLYRMRSTQGFTLIEILVAVSIFAMLGIALYTMATAALHGISRYRDTATVAALADQYLEIAENLPYAKVGTLSGNPYGPLPDQPNALTVSYGTTSYQIYYTVYNVFDPSDGASVVETDYKQVKVFVKNLMTGRMTAFTTDIMPQGLENGLNGGALALQVFDAVGQPVPNASVTITNSALTPPINITRTTDSSGNWIEVGLPTSTASYHIVASKGGYSSDQTYPSSVSNPNPTKPDATVLSNSETAISFAIDRTSDLELRATDQACHPLSNIGIELKGSKLIGTPNVLKFDNTYSTGTNGNISLTPLEWDTYTPTIASAGYMIYGSSPIQKINLLPGTTQVASLMVGPTTANSLLVIVKDASSGNPLEGASVELSDATLGFDSTKLTAGSTLYQDDWSGGSGQNDFTVSNKFAADDGNVDTASLPVGLRLQQVSGEYVPTGQLTSSSFDTGTASSTYTTLTWNPTSQTASTSLAFQIATNNDDATWNYVGPDGTAATYFTVPGTAISAANNNTRYLRYRAYLGSASTTSTPVLSNVTVNYVSGCFTPGQAMYAGLTSDPNYQLMVSMPGYQTQTLTGISISGNRVIEVSLSM